METNCVIGRLIGENKGLSCAQAFEISRCYGFEMRRAVWPDGKVWKHASEMPLTDGDKTAFDWEIASQRTVALTDLPG